MGPVDKLIPRLPGRMAALVDYLLKDGKLILKTQESDKRANKQGIEKDSVQSTAPIQ
ncbi:hypothetical protein KIN20_000452 [Parelaphostrongylus tenuis]|uniref:Uncharacterized protein n=1 Tax=Parelaphostrongylus tenuis TaxID=148309 RepID=A0AAD5MBB6_PARTN|nr:hypothetical protein KIN20_000452 [Parelaphostrongylus tenuis]